MRHSDSARPRVSVVVPLHNGRELIPDCLDSIPPDAEIIVVDDASEDGAPEVVRRRFPRARLIHNERNLGFGSTANRGLAQATGDICVVLNSDARLTPGALEVLCAAFDDPGIGIAGPRLVFPDGTHQTSAAAFPRPANVITGAFLANELFRRLFPRRRFPFELGLARRDHRESRYVDWVLGPCLAIRRSALAGLDGGFDEGYFMYAEETDLCWRARRAGWRVRLVADATVVHLGGGSSGDPVLGAERSMRSEARFMARAYGPAGLRRWRLARTAGALLKIPLLAGPACVDRRARTRLAWQKAALRYVTGPGWRSGVGAGAPPKQSPSVLLVQVTADLYGSDRSLLYLVRALVTRGWRARVVVPYRGPLISALEDAGAAVVVAPVGAPRRVFSPAQWLRFAILELPRSALAVRREARGVDLVHVSTALTAGAALGARAAGRPLVWQVRELFRDAPRVGRVYGRLMRLADVVIANSPATAEEARQVGLDDRLRLVWEGVDFGPLPEPVDAGAAPPGVVTVGRINSTKGHDVLVDALALLRDRGRPVPATIAGDPFRGGEAHLERLVRRISAHGLEELVSLPGYVHDVYGLMAGFGIFVFPSTRPESFGFALVDAMAMGLACIASDHGGPHYIVEDGRTGVLVPPGDAGALAGAIDNLVVDVDRRRRLGRAAAVEVRSRFALEGTVDATLAVYQELLARRGPVSSRSSARAGRP